jgi:hypothetical protein
MIVAAGLFAFIFFYHRHRPEPVTGPGRVLPGLKASSVTNVQVRPGAQLEIRAVRTNGGWELTEPVVYPAQAVSIERLLAELEQLTPMTYISARELRGRPKADEEFGLAAPQATITFQQPDYHALVQIGARTAPGDQVFVGVAGVEGVYVVDAEFLKQLPRSANDWRDTSLLDLNELAFDRVSVTNGAKVFELRRDGRGNQWRLVYPVPVRANNPKVEESLQRLQNLRVQQFVSDDPKVDLEPLGLQPPQLELALGKGASTLALLQVGKSPTNDNRQVYVRRLGRNTVVTVPADLLAPWREKINDFRDRHLVALNEPVGIIEVRGEENFSVQQQTNGAWRVMPLEMPADTDFVKDLLANLSSIPIVEFVNDVVIAADLPTYGLAPPVRQYLLMSAATNSATAATNALVAELDFGTNQAEKIFARRADETFVYAVKAADFQRLPSAAWQLRDRRIWNFTTNDVARVVVQQEGQTRQIIRNGPFSWSFAEGSQGIINDLAVEQTVAELGQLAAGAWVARGEPGRARYGFTEKGHRITVELKNGEKFAVEFGAEAPSGFRYAAVTLDGALWIFEFPPAIYQHVAGYLSIPAGGR